MAIYIIFAPPRTGKTCFMTHTLNGYAFEKETSLCDKKLLEKIKMDLI